MKDNITKREILEEIEEAEKELTLLDERTLRLWERTKVPPTQWKQEQYTESDDMWVIALLGNRCLYFNFVEEGWGWGFYEKWGVISEYHWQQDEIQHALLHTMFAIDNGAKVNRVRAGFSPALPTTPRMLGRTGRFASHLGNGTLPTVV